MEYRIRGFDRAVAIAEWLEINEVEHEVLEDIHSPTTFEKIPLLIRIDNEEQATLFLLRWS